MVRFSMNSDFENNYISISHNFQHYNKIISRITNQKYQNIPLQASFKMTNSSEYNKYHFKLKNFFFYKLNNDLWKSNLFFSYTSKYIKYIKFDVFPNIKLIITNSNFPIKLTLKHGKYQSSRNQNIVDYEFSSLLKSMLPYSKSALGIEYFHRDNYNFLNNPLFSIIKVKGAYNKIHSFEDNIKILSSIKSIYEINNLTDHFKIQLTNQLNVKKSFIGILDRKKKNDTKDNHITSGFDFRSKILGINFMERESIIDNRSDFIIQNHFELRLKDFEFLRKRNIAVFEPFIGFESIIVPHYNREKINWETSLKFIFNAGISIRLNEHMTFDISLFTKAKSQPEIKPNLINRIRINVNINSNLEK